MRERERERIANERIEKGKIEDLPIGAVCDL